MMREQSHRAAFEDEDEDEVDEGPKGPQRGTYPRDFGHQRTRKEVGRKDPPGIRCAAHFVCILCAAPRQTAEPKRRPVRMLMKQ